MSTQTGDGMTDEPKVALVKSDASDTPPAETVDVSDKSGPRKLPLVEIDADNQVHVYPTSGEEVKALFGAKGLEFASALIPQALNVSGNSGVLMEDGKAALAIIAELEPNGAVEALLTTQMAAVHIAIMRHSQMMATATTIKQLEIQERVFNKLARTFTAQTEALRKHRNGGQQKMVVEHVTVNDGGQAIVGNILKGGAADK